MAHSELNNAGSLLIGMTIALIGAGCSTVDPSHAMVELRPPGAPAPAAVELPASVAQLQLAVVPRRACLHLKQHTNNYMAYSEVYAEVWVQDCDSEERLPAQLIEIGSRYRPREHYNYKSCANTSTCVFEERTYGYGVSFYCVMGRLRDSTLGTAVLTYPKGYDGLDCLQ